MPARRVHELAKTLGLSSAQVLRELEGLGRPAGSASANVDEDVAAVLADRFPGGGPSHGPADAVVDSDLVPLVIRAFEQARASKPESWRTMTLPVLKNRLLQLTDRRFGETAYGHRSFREVVASLPALLELDEQARPATVTLRDPSAVPAPQATYRVRRDLWDAVMDFSAGHAWAWDGGRALPADDAPAGAPRLPTLTPDELAGWRAEFAEAHDTSGNGALDGWATSSGATRQLPPALRPLWNAELKFRVLDRLSSWFPAQGLPVPDDAATTGPAGPADDAGPARAGSLRTFVSGCVALMTDDELAGLVIPATAAHRYAEGKK